MELEFVGRRSLISELNQRADSFTTDINATKNRDLFITRWQTVHAQIQVSFRSFVFVFLYDIFSILVFAVAERTVCYITENLLLYWPC